jgi:outer membrane protein assembly factor BamD (BamD/ComL family)
VCLAGVILISSVGCAHDRSAPEPRPSCEPKPLPVTQPGAECERRLQAVQAEIEIRDFDSAIRECKHVLAQPIRERQHDLALFDLGLLYAHYANPRKDYKTSLLYFSRLIREHPGSPLAEEAKIWADMLETMEKTKQVDMELEERTKALNK